MAQRDLKRNTIARQHTLRLLLALAAGALVFLLLVHASEFCLDQYLDRSGYYDTHDRQYVQSLQDYADREKVSAEDADALTAWGDQQKNVFFQVYADDQLVFQYYSRDSRSFREAAGMEFLEWIKSYPVRFADGEYQVIVFGDYYYQPFRYVMVGNVLIAFGVFLLIFLTGIRKRTRYIRKLRDEIEILGSGDLQYEVTVQGNDELTDLAENLNQMRQALKHHMDEEARLTEERQTLVSRLSHDIRTPLTSMNLFADLIRRGDYADEAQRDHYLDRIQENTANLTKLAEELFQVTRSRTQGSAGVPKETVYVAAVLADAAEALRLSGFTVEEQYDGADGTVTIHCPSFSRVLDNLTSTILRDADPMQPVRISCEVRGGETVISLANGVSPSEDAEVSGSGIGLQNVRSLVQQAKGTVRIDQDPENFRISLIFPLS